MIPKIIHYCWLSDDPIPSKLQKYMNTWKKYLPEYEFMLWNFERFPKSKSKWVSDAFDNKKYAFAADYIRLYALYNYGGIYLDTDVEIIKSFNPFLNAREMICRETSGGPEVAVFGVEKNCKWIKICLDSYIDKNFIKKDGSFDMCPLPEVIQNTLYENGFIFKDISTPIQSKEYTNLEIPILPNEYFSPKSHSTGKIKKTNNTFAIHHFEGSWLPWYNIIEKKFFYAIGLESKNYIGGIIYRLKKVMKLN